MSRKMAAALREEDTAASLRFAQRLSATLHRESARAILKRLVPVDSPAWAPSPEEWAGAEAQAEDL